MLTSLSRAVSEMGLFRRSKKQPARRPQKIKREVDIWLGLPAGRKVAIPAGTRLTTVREPDNSHDPNAVALHFGDKGRVGYIAKEQAKTISAEIEAGTNYTVTTAEKWTVDRDSLVSTSGLLQGWTI